MAKTSERSPRLREPTFDRLAGWARSQVAAWRDAPRIDQEAIAAKLSQLEAASPSIFLFDFAVGSVGIRKKSPASRHPNAGSAAELQRRAQLYLQLFRHVTAGFKLDFSFLLAIDVDDHPLDQAEIPLFSFQKRADSSLILLPDIDLLAGDHFISPDVDDTLAFEDKADAAVFVGATTGADVTREVVETLSLPRLKSAVFFRDVAGVTFHLPKIVQYDNEETAALIRALGVTGVPLTWKEQFRYKYLLSMDGNGATCSRVAIALKSRCVLIKYDSDFQLFYFEGLQAGREFLTASTNQDALDTIQMCRNGPRQAASVAQAGRRFAQEHLSRLPVMTYVAYLLDGYARAVLKQDVDPVDVRQACPALEGYGHVQDAGDIRPVPGGWLGGLDSQKVIEGFALEPGPEVQAMDISYQAVLSDGSLSGRCFGYDFCGTRGLARPLQGFRLSLGGRAALDYRLSYVGAFSDGSLVGPTPDGAVCRSPSEANLTGLRLIVQRNCHPPNAV